jgi:hypothetical protein
MTPEAAEAGLWADPHSLSRLTDALRALGDEFGPMAVARIATVLTHPSHVAQAAGGMQPQLVPALSLVTARIQDRSRPVREVDRHG